MPDPPDTIHFHADRGDARLRLDQVLVRRITEISRLSRNVAQQWIECGAVSVDGVAVSRPSTRVREGATIVVTLPDTAVRRLRPAGEPGELDMLYEDDDIVIVNKPAGLVVHPTYKHPSGTLLNALLWRFRDRGDLRPGILTRLDRDTSGIVVIALTADMHAAMQRDAAAGRIRKEYLAVTEGIPEPPAGTIALPLARDPADRRRVVATPDGARSETRYELLSSIGGRSVVRCELVTGRTHQIRVHLSARGWPIVGDRAYGLADEGIARQALHAWRISLPHPRTAAPLAAQAPLPHDIAGLLGVHDEALSPDQRTQGGHQHQHDAEGDDNGGAGRQVED